MATLLLPSLHIPNTKNEKFVHPVAYEVPIVADCAFFPVSISVSLQKTQLHRTLSGSVQRVCSSVIAIINLAVAARLLLDNSSPTSNTSGTVRVTFLAYTFCIESHNNTTK